MFERLRKRVVVAATLLLTFCGLQATAGVAKIGETEYETLAEAVAAARTGDTVGIIAAGTYKVPGIPNNVTIKGMVDDVVFDCVGPKQNSIASVPNGCTFANVAFTMGTTDYHGFQHAGLITMKDCTIEGKFFSYGDMVFEGCTFNQTAADYCMWCYAGNIDYKDCTVNCNGKFANVYNEGNGTWKITAEGCTFNSTKPNKAAFNVKATCTDKGVVKPLAFEISVENCTANENFPSASTSDNLVVFNPFIQVDDRNESVESKIDVTYEGVVLMKDNAAVEGPRTINNKDELLAFAAEVNAGSSFKDKTVVLGADIDLAEVTWVPIGNVKDYPGVTFAGTFDGQNHTIANLTTSDTTQDFAAAGLFGSLAGTVKNVKLTNVDVRSSHYAGGIVGYSSDTSSTTVIENCHVEGGKVTSTPEMIKGAYDNGDKVGGLAGYIADNDQVINCTVKNLTVTGYRDVGGAIGYANGGVTVKDVRVEGSKVVNDRRANYKNYTTVDQYDCHEVVGEKSGSATIENSTFSDVKIEFLDNVAKIGVNQYATLAAAVAAANAGDVIEIIKADTYTIPNLPKNVTITGTVDGVVFNCSGTGSIASVPNGATFGNVTMNFGSTGYHGFQHAGTINMNGCTLNGLFFSYGDMNFNGCTFNAPGTEASGIAGKDYSMWAYGKDLSFTDCTFNCAGKCINVYCESNSEAYDVSFTRCEFNSTVANKAAINIKETCGTEALKYNVSVTDCTANGAFPTASADATGTLYVVSPLIQIDDRNLADDFESAITVKLGEEDAYPVAKPVAQIGDTTYATLAEAVAAAVAAKDGVAVELLCDIDLTGKTWTPVAYNGGKLTIDGKGFTVTGLSDELLDKVGSGSHELTVRNITFDQANIVKPDDAYVAVVCGYADSMPKLSFENVTVKNSTVKGSNYAGAFVGYYAAYYAEDAVSYKNCKVENCTITGGGSVGALVGHANGSVNGSVTVDGCTVTGNTIASTGSSTVKAGAVCGTVGAAPLSVSATVSGNTVTSCGAAVTTVYGRQGSTGGALTLTGGTYDKNPIAEADASWAKPTSGYEVVQNANGTYGIEELKVAKIGETTYATLEEAFAAAQSGDQIDILKAGTYTFATSAASAIVGVVDGVVFDASASGNVAGYSAMTMRNVTIDFGAAQNYHGFQNASNLAFENCTLKGLSFSYGGVQTYRNCTFVQDSVEYCMWVYGGDVTYDGCTFDTCGKALNVYNEGNGPHAVVVKNCTFKNENNPAKKPAVLVKSTCGAKELEYAVELDGTNTLVGNWPTSYEDGNIKNNGLWDVEGDGSKIEISVNEEKVYPLARVAKIGDMTYATLADALVAAVAAKDGVAVELLCDIDLTGKTWTPVAYNGGKLTIDGKGFTVTGLSAGGLLKKTGSGSHVLTVKDITFDAADVTDVIAGYAAVVCGYADSMPKLSFENVTVKNSTVTGSNYAGAFVGYYSAFYAEDAVSYKNCKVENSTITGGGSVGALVGHANGSVNGSVTVDGCTVTGNTIASTGSSTVKAGAVCGTVGAAPLSVSATVSGNTVTSCGAAVTTVYGRQGSDGGALTLTGGSYDKNPIAEADASWAKPTAGYEVVQNANGTYGIEELKVAKIGDVKYATLAEAVAAADTEAVIEIIKADTYTIPNLPKNVTITGTVDGVVFNCAGTGSIASVPNGATFGNVTMNFGSANYHGFYHAGTINMNGCTLNGLFFSYGDMNFNGCTFNAPGAEYSMWCYGKDCTYVNCTFNGQGKYLNVYCEDSETTYNITVTGCRFVNTGVKNKAALNVKETCGSTPLKYNVVVADCTTEGAFPDAQSKEALYVISPLVQVDDRNLADDFESSITVKLDDEDVYPLAKPVAQIGDVKYATLAEAVEAVKGGETILLLKDNAENISLPTGVPFDTNGKAYKGTVSAKVEGDVVTCDGAGVYVAEPLPQAYVTTNPDAATTNGLDVAFSFDVFNPSDMAIYEKIVSDTPLTEAEEARYEELYAQLKPFFNWHADFVVTFDKPVKKGSVELAGQYGTGNAWYDGNWMSFPLPKDLDANEPLRLLKDGLEGLPIYESFEQILTEVVRFQCGVRNLSDANIGTKMTVELRLYEPDYAGDRTKDETGRFLSIVNAEETSTYTFVPTSEYYVYDDETTRLSVSFPRAWISSADGLGIPAAEATDAKIDETLEAVQANGLPTWQNVLLGIDGANTAGLLATFAKDPASSAAEPKVIVTFKGLDAARQPTWETGVTVTYTLYTSADASSWTAVTEGATSTKAGVSYKMPTSSESVKTWLYQLRVNLEQKANQ